MLKNWKSKNKPNEKLEINEIEMKKTVQNINKTKAAFLKRTGQTFSQAN